MSKQQNLKIKGQKYKIKGHEISLSLSIYLSISLSIYLSISLSIYLSISGYSIYLSILLFWFHVHQASFGFSSQCICLFSLSRIEYPPIMHAVWGGAGRDQGSTPWPRGGKLWHKLWQTFSHEVESCIELPRMLSSNSFLISASQCWFLLFTAKETAVKPINIESAGFRLFHTAYLFPVIGLSFVLFMICSLYRRKTVK